MRRSTRPKTPPAELLWPSAEEDAAILRGARADADNPPLTTEEQAQSRPFSAVFPDAFAAWQKKRGRPKAESPKVHIGFRLAPDVVAGVKASGPGYNARVEKVLREALEKGRL